MLPLDAFAPIFEPLHGQHVGYLRIPGNVGDHLIERATFDLMTRFGITWDLINWRDYHDTHEHVLHAGGGSLGSLYGYNPYRNFLKTLKARVTILPQSMYDYEEMPFDRVFIRERESLKLCPNGILAPDLALSIAYWPEKPWSEAVGVFLRSDDAEMLPKRICPCPAPNSGDPTKLCSTPQQYLWLASRYRHIITDRLHFAIAGLITRRRVTLLPNAYHKNRSMWETWLRDLGCEFAENSKEVVDR